MGGGIMLDFIAQSACTGCGACAAVCPQGCISFFYDDEGFLYPEKGPECVNCGKCHSVCPIANYDASGNLSFPQFAVAARHRDKIIWAKSSSGGAFSAICKAYCNDGDAIFGARFDGLDVVHDCIYHPDPIDDLMKSKYVQSDMRDSYHKVMCALKNNRKVLFSGTPCQIAGLKSFLCREYENLLCVDLICHGVGSPGVFKKYVSYLEKKYNSRIKSFSFRNKKIAWGRSIEHIIKIDFEDGTSIENSRDLYNTGFIHTLFLRPACYECRFANLRRVGDITIGDFKKRHELLPHVNGLENLSTVIVNTSKGNEVFKKLNDYMDIYPVPIEVVAKTNNPLHKPATMKEKRGKFFRDLALGVPIEEALRQNISVSWLMKLWSIIPDRTRAELKGWARWIRR